MQLKNKFILMPLVIMIPILTGLGIISYLLIENNAQNALVAKEKLALTMTDTIINKYFENIANATELLAQLSIFNNIGSAITSYTELSDPSGKVPMFPRNEYEEAVIETCKNFTESFEDAFTVSVGAEENGGFIMYPTAARKNGYDARQRGWYKAAVATNRSIAFSDPYKTTAGEFVITCGKKIVDAAQNLQGVVTIDANLKFLSDFLETVRQHDNSTIILLDTAGTIIAHSDNYDMIFKNITDLNIEKLKDFKRLVRFTAPVNGHDSQISSALSSY